MDTEIQSLASAQDANGGSPSDVETGQVQASPDSLFAGYGSQSGNGQADEEISAKRAKWKAQKAAQRARKGNGGTRPGPVAQPAPLPSLAPGEASPFAAESGTLDAGEVAADIAMVDWTPEEIQEISDEIIAGLNEADKASMVKLAVAGHLPEEVIKQIEADAGMPSLIQKFLKRYLPKLIAKKLNDAKISADGKETAIVVGSLAYYVIDRIATRRRVEKLIKQHQGQKP